MKTIVERLRSRPGEAITRTEKLLDEAATLIEAQAARIELLEAALKPFADQNKGLDRDYSDYKDSVRVFFDLTHRDFRTAARALNGGE